VSSDQITYVLVALIVAGVAILLLLVGALVARRGRRTQAQGHPAPIEAGAPPAPAAAPIREPSPSPSAADRAPIGPPVAQPSAADAGPLVVPGAAEVHPAAQVGPPVEEVAAVTAADREAAARRLHDPREEEIIQGFLSMPPRRREAAAFEAPRPPTAAAPSADSAAPPAPMPAAAPVTDVAAPVGDAAPAPATAPAPASTEPDRLPADPYLDDVTGLDSRAAWERVLAEENARYVRYRRPVGLVVAELDGLGRFEGQFGQDAAERVLGAVGGAMRRSARRTDRVAHVGGGRFLVLLPETDEIQAINYVERVRAECERWLEAGAVSLHLSMGWASPSAVGELDTALRSAEERMYVERRRATRAGATDSDARR
jgi:diguanylate cyclase (GGDEF)-like protein